MTTSRSWPACRATDDRAPDRGGRADPPLPRRPCAPARKVEKVNPRTLTRSASRRASRSRARMPTSCSTSSSSPTPTARPGPRPTARAIAARRLLRHRGRPVGGRGRLGFGLEYLLGVADHRGRRAATTCPSGATTATASATPSSASSTSSSSATQPTRDARLPLRRLRVRRHQTTHATPRTPVKRRSTSSSATRSSSISQRRPAGHPGIGRVVLDQAHRALLHVEREGPVTEAGFSVVQYETWLRDAAHPRHLLDDLAAYNRDDCVSTWKLRDWLEARRRKPSREAGRCPGRRPARGRAPRSSRSRRPRPAGERQALRGGLSRRRSELDEHGPGPLAARPARRLAPPRGQARVVELATAPAGDADRATSRGVRRHRRARVRRTTSRTRSRASSAAIASRARIMLRAGRTPSIRTSGRPGADAGTIVRHRRRGSGRSICCGPKRAWLSTRALLRGDAAPDRARSETGSADSLTGSSTTASTPTDRSGPLVTCSFGGRRGS